MTTPGEYETQRLAAASATYRTKVARLKAIRDEVAGGCCSCGPNCREHAPTTDRTEQGA